VGMKVDKSDSSGVYIYSYGGLSHESAKYNGWTDVFTVDSTGRLIACSGAARKIIVFSRSAPFFSSYPLLVGLPKWFPFKIKAERDGSLLILGYSSINGYRLIRYNLKTNRYRVLHTDNDRIRPLFQDLPPDFDLDSQGNIYVTHTIDYEVVKYNPAGRIIARFFRPVEKIEIQDSDFNVLTRPGRIEKIQDYKELWKKLEGRSRYFPAVFGINIDGDRVYVWTSRQDDAKKYRVDVYDLNFRILRTVSSFNVMGTNLAVIKNGKFYLPDIGSDDKELVNAIGRFGVFNIPHRIEVYGVAGSLTMMNWGATSCENSLAMSKCVTTK